MNESEYANASIAKFDALPVNVHVIENFLVDPTSDAINAMNIGLGYNVYGMSDESYLILVQCGTEFPNDFIAYTIVHHNTINARIVSSDVYIDCTKNFDSWVLSHVIAHELYHSIGFLEHSPNEDCLMNRVTPVYADIENEICYDMNASFNSTYGIPNDRSVDVILQ